jgi:hypothetical protein
MQRSSPGGTCKMTAQPEADPKRNRPTGIGILTLPPSECRSQNSKMQK